LRKENSVSQSYDWSKHTVYFVCTGDQNLYTMYDALVKVPTKTLLQNFALRAYQARLSIKTVVMHLINRVLVIRLGNFSISPNDIAANPKAED